LSQPASASSVERPSPYFSGRDQNFHHRRFDLEASLARCWRSLCSLSSAWRSSCISSLSGFGIWPAAQFHSLIAHPFCAHGAGTLRLGLPTDIVRRAASCSGAREAAIIPTCQHLDPPTTLLIRTPSGEEASRAGAVAWSPCRISRRPHDPKDDERKAERDEDECGPPYGEADNDQRDTTGKERPVVCHKPSIPARQGVSSESASVTDPLTRQPTGLVSRALRLHQGRSAARVRQATFHVPAPPNPLDPRTRLLMRTLDWTHIPSQTLHSRRLMGAAVARPLAAARHERSIREARNWRGHEGLLPSSA